MRSETKLRNYLAALRYAVELPCECQDPGDRAECREGREAVGREIRLLEWVLGDSDDMNDLVAHMITAAALR